MDIGFQKDSTQFFSTWIWHFNTWIQHSQRLYFSVCSLQVPKEHESSLHISLQSNRTFYRRIEHLKN
uniref:Uncharacterized protein n=1 Tax=Arundo donax TaxID=35708 RepID=A0A0A9DGC9_ARUDO